MSERKVLSRFLVDKIKSMKSGDRCFGSLIIPALCELGESAIPSKEKPWIADAIFEYLGTSPDRVGEGLQGLDARKVNELMAFLSQAHAKLRETVDIDPETGEISILYTGRDNVEE